MHRKNVMHTYPCLRCGDDYDGKRRASHFCPRCRDIRRTEYKAEHERHRRAIARDVRLDADIYRASYQDNNPDVELTTEWLMDAHSESVFATIADYADAIDSDEQWSLVPVWSGDPLVGATSNAGPDDGMSTTWQDLAYQLDERAAEAAQHPWFNENPHWSYELDDPNAAAEYLDAA